MSVPWYLMAKGKGGGGYKTASGPIVSVNDALAAPLRSLVADIDPVQDLHGYDAPWPSGGGKNKFGCADGTYAIGSTRTVTVTDSAWAYKVNTSATSSVFLPDATVTAMNIPVLKPGTYTFSLVSNAASSSIIAAAVLNLSDGQAITNGNSFTISADSSVVSITTPISGEYAVGTYTCQIQIESGTSATAWTPYSNICPISGWSAVNVWLKPAYDPTANPTATIQLGQTVYGGTLDVTNGVLTVTMAMVDMGTLTWQYVSDDVFFTSALYGIKKPGINNYINSTYGFSDASFANMPDKTMKGNTTAGGIYVKDSAFGQNPNTAKSGLSGVQLCYELATPITISLTPTEISTLQGQNNLWADSGDVDVEYLASGGANAELMKLAVAFMGRK